MSDKVYQLKREFEKIVDEKNPIMLANRSDSSVWTDCYYCHPNTSQAATLQKRVLALKRTLPGLYALLIPIVDRLLAKQIQIEAAKAEHAKAKAARKQAAETKRKEKAANKANPYRTLHPEVAKLMREVAEPYRIEAIRLSTERQNALLVEIDKAYAICGTYRPYTMFPTNTKMDRYTYEMNAYRASEAFRFVEEVNCKWVKRLLIPSIVARAAKDFAEAQVNAFVLKVGTKLSGIVERKGNLKEAKISGSLQDHWMTLTFEDGSSFQVQSQIVWKVSINGVHFAQYPTCFRNVVLADGSRMELPSEAKMKERFV